MSEEKNSLKKITLLDRIKRLFGYREGEKFIIYTLPEIKNYSDIELQCQKVVNNNKSMI